MTQPADYPFFQIDAFTNEAFAGNPAAIIPLQEWLPDELLQQIAAENNLSETAFFVSQAQGYQLRWFTPTVEVDLCGHATLAAAHVLFAELDEAGESVSFSSRSGELRVAKGSEASGWLTLDFPARSPEASTAPAGLLDALGLAKAEVLHDENWLVVVDSETTVAGLQPEFAQLAGIQGGGVIVTAVADATDVDFVSRFFAPAYGIDEDPVTGSAHCSLIPYWAGRLGKQRMTARQISARGGLLRCELDQDRVRISGQAVTVIRGVLTI